MKKILLIVVAIVAIAAVATPGILGGKIESQIKTIVEGYNNVPGYSVDIVEYEKSYFSSTVKLLVKYTLPGFEGAMPSEFLEVLANEGVPIDMEISHGPIVLSPAMAIASGVAKTSIPNDAKIVALIGEYVDIETGSDFDTVVFGLTGGAKSSSTINKVTVKDPDGIVEFVVSDIDTSMVMDNIRLVGGYPLSDGASEIAVGSISVKAKDGPAGEPVVIDFSDLKVLAEVNSDGELLNVVYKIAMGSFSNKGLPSSPISDKSIDGLAFDFSLENLSESVFVELMKVSSNPLLMGSRESSAKLQGLASELLKDGPKFSIDKMTFSVDGAEFDGSFDISFDSSKVGDITKLAHPMMAIPALNANLDLTFAESLVDLTKSGVPAWRRDSMSEEQIVEFEKQQDQAVKMKKDMLVQQGFFKKEGDEFTTSIQFKEGKLNVNGKAQPLPF